ncbi:hypothetical protein B0H67DRAFT_645195 [Lasiosphaeris hirsuta]|uniref:Uncharacterized protein n=1 Tax=Lasiosphaeris hirsuta TaxID=260670 RepID=A0AA40DTZ0_9PEZI|nr:hypothetical protein B0H67DRAFT_645195 [Lasiosphaeris hirsuta]
MRSAPPSPLLRWCRSLQLLSLPSLLAAPALVASFGTINAPVIGQHNEHELITRLAFQCPDGAKSDGFCFEPRSLDQLAGHHLHVLGVPIVGGGFNGAVGSPDTLDPIPEGPEAHCDDADFIDIPGYPRTRAEATATLQACVDHLRGRFRQAWGSAERLLDDKGAIRNAMVDLRLSEGVKGDCSFAFASFQINAFGRAKCSALEGLGRALHGVQDFYAHSNWADRSDPARPISATNPPGLARTDSAPFLVNLDANDTIPASQIPVNLTTGCFYLLSDDTPGAGPCSGRVTHNTLSKDHGIIYLDGTFGEVGQGTPRVESVPDNFGLAVRAAVKGSRDVWVNLQNELLRRYGSEKGDLMICSLVRDDPVNDCGNYGVSNLSGKAPYARAPDAESLAEQQHIEWRLVAADETDQVTEIQVDELMQAAYPLGNLDPAMSDAVGGALAFAINKITAAHLEAHSDGGAMVLITAGSECASWLEDALIRVQNPSVDGIGIDHSRVDAPQLSRGDFESENQLGGSSCCDGVIRAVPNAGGAVAVSSSSGRTTNFGSLAMGNDSSIFGDTLASNATSASSPGVALTDFSNLQYTARYLSYSQSVGENVIVKLQDRMLGYQGTGWCFTAASKNKALRVEIATISSCGGAALLHLAYDDDDYL